MLAHVQLAGSPGFSLIHAIELRYAAASGSFARGFAGSAADRAWFAMPLCHAAEAGLREV